MEDSERVLVVNPEWNEKAGRNKSRREDNMKTDLK
jgi:hypothetical protein